MLMYECLGVFEWLVLHIYICLVCDGLYVGFFDMVNKLSIYLSIIYLSTHYRSTNNRSPTNNTTTKLTQMLSGLVLALVVFWCSRMRSFVFGQYGRTRSYTVLLGQLWPSKCYETTHLAQMFFFFILKQQKAYITPIFNKLMHSVLGDAIKIYAPGWNDNIWINRTVVESVPTNPLVVFYYW